MFSSRQHITWRLLTFSTWAHALNWSVKCRHYKAHCAIATLFDDQFRSSMRNVTIQKWVCINVRRHEIYRWNILNIINKGTKSKQFKHSFTFGTQHQSLKIFSFELFITWKHRRFKINCQDKTITQLTSEKWIFIEQLRQYQGTIGKLNDPNPSRIYTKLC